MTATAATYENVALAAIADACLTIGGVVMLAVAVIVGLMFVREWRKGGAR